MLTQGYIYPGVLPHAPEVWLDTKMDIAGVEMEFATLLVIASMYGVRAGGIFTSDGNLTEEVDPQTYDPHRNVFNEGKEKMLKIALEALVRLA
jgi:uridine phosphorylase